MQGKSDVITMYHVENMPDDCLVLKRGVNGNSDGTVQCALHAECADHAVLVECRGSIT